MMTAEDMRDDENDGRRDVGEKYFSHWVGIFDSVSLSGPVTAALMYPYMSLAEERPTKNRPTHNIGWRIKTMKMAYQLDYWTQDCSGGLWQ